MHLRYFHLKAADVDAAITDSQQRHKQATGGAELSIAWNVGNTEALIKVEGADKDWRDGKEWITNALHVYDNDNKYDRFTDLGFYGPKWQPKDAG